MTPRFKAEHRHQVDSGRAPRDLPVLFHLMDVSRPRRQHAAVEAPAAGEFQLAGNTVLPITPQPAITSPDVVPQRAIPMTPIEAVEAEAVEEPANAIGRSVRDESQAERNAKSEVATAPAVLESTAATTLTKAVVETTANSAAQTAQAPRPRATESRRKLKTPLVEDWFSTHGRYIALGFVLALIATIYFARMNRQSPPAVTAESDSHSATTDHPGTADRLVGQPLVKSATKSPADEVDGQAAVAKTSPPMLTGGKSSETDSKAELHPPTIPQLASQPPATDKPQSEDGLFRFSKKNEPRVAARTDGPTTIVNPTIAPGPAASADAGNSPAAPYLPATVPPQAVAPFPAAAPAAMPVYPQTPYPPTGYSPPTAYSPAAYPMTSAPSPAMPPVLPPGPPTMHSQYQIPAATPGPQQPQTQTWSPPLPPGGPPSQYIPQDQAARGLRYERTGSGLY